MGVDKCDNVEMPKHYLLNNGMQSVDVLRASMTKEAFEGWCEGNILKYLLRWRKKNGVEDLKKARVYCGWLIESLETEKESKDEKDEVPEETKKQLEDIVIFFLGGGEDEMD